MKMERDYSQNLLIFTPFLITLPLLHSPQQNIYSLIYFNGAVGEGCITFQFYKKPRTKDGFKEFYFP